MEPEDIQNPDSELGASGATPQNGGGPASSPPPDVVGNDLHGNAEQVTTVSLVNDALQVEEVEQVRYNKDGTIRRKPGRKAGQKNGEGVGAQATPKVVRTPAQVQAQKVSSEQVATVILKSTIETLVMTIGEEWQFENQQEADAMKASVVAFIDAKGGASLSPETMLALSVASYALPRTRHPNTRDKIAGFFKGLWRAIRGVKSL